MRQRSWTLRLILGACALALLAGGAAQAQVLVSAQVLSSEGQVEIRRRAVGAPAAARINYRPHDVLRAGDTIITHRGARLVLGLSDGSQAIIGEQTTVEISSLAGTPRDLFRILRGRTRVRIERTGGQPNPYRVNTPTAVIAVRGTIFDVIVRDRETQVFVHEGTVAVNNLLEPERAVILNAGQRTRVVRDRLPETPATFRPGRNDETFSERAPVRAEQAGGASAGDDLPGRSGQAPTRDRPGVFPTAAGPPASAPAGQPRAPAGPGRRP